MQLQNEGESSSSFAALESMPNVIIEEMATSTEGLVEAPIEDEAIPNILPVEEPNEEDEDEPVGKKAELKE